MKFRIGERPFTTTDIEIILKAYLYGFSGSAEYMAIREIVERRTGEDGEENKHDRRAGKALAKAI